MSAALIERWQGVKARIAAAEQRCGRGSGSTRLIAVSKTKPAGDVQALLEAGQLQFGENRVQEALAKQEELAGLTAASGDAEWHLIGRLQKNKARHAVGRFALIHGVDSLALARELSKRAAAAGLVQPVLIQLNLAAEETKAGIAEAELPQVLDEIAALPSLDLRGLMSIPPPVAQAEESRPWFRLLRKARDEASRRLGRELSELSMGMTDDFEVAIEEGATLVRVGTAIFGARDSAQPE